MSTSRRTKKMSPRKVRRVPGLASGSWLALLAATTLGVDGASTLRAEVSADDGLVEGRDYRLVIQSFDGSDGVRPSFRTRPVASSQRAVTAAELRDGVKINLVELRQEQVAQNDGAVVAWIEAGKPDLEFDGRTARPRPGSMVGLARRSGSAPVQIRLTRDVAA